MCCTLELCIPPVLFLRPEQESRLTACPGDRRLLWQFFQSSHRTIMIVIVSFQLTHCARLRRCAFFQSDVRIVQELVDTPAMQAGREQHAILEAETALNKVHVPIESREDAFAVRLINLDESLKQLILSGITRELPLFGTLQARLHGLPCDFYCHHYAKRIVFL